MLVAAVVTVAMVMVVSTMPQGASGNEVETGTGQGTDGAQSEGGGSPGIEIGPMPWVDLPTRPEIVNVDTSLNYTTIQECVDAPETLDGHTISVSAGTLFEGVTVNKRLTLAGDGMDQTTLIVLPGFGIGINITADGVSVSGFKIIDGTYGIAVNNASGVSISQVNCSGHSGAGFLVAYSEATINDCLGSGNEYAAVLLHSNDCGLTNSTFSGRRGIVVDRSDRATVSNMTINSGESGAELYSSEYSRVDNCTFVNLLKVIGTKGGESPLFDADALAQGTGVYLHGSSYNTVTECHFQGNEMGVEIDMDSYDNLLYRNDFLDNAIQAFDAGENDWNLSAPIGGNFWSDFTTPDDDRDGFVDLPHMFFMNGCDYLPFAYESGWLPLDDDAPFVNLNILRGYYDLQLAVDEADPYDTILVRNGTHSQTCEIYTPLTLTGLQDGTAVLDGGGSGTCIRVESDGVTIRDMTLQNADFALVADDVDDLAIERVTACEVDMVGFEIFARHATLRNITSYNNWWGIYLSSSSYVLVHDAVCYGNGGDGLMVRDSNHITVFNASCQSNGQHGLNVYNSVGVNVFFSLFSSNVWEGVNIDPGFNLMIRGCNISGNGDSGIDARGSSSNITVEDCLFLSNANCGIFTYSCSGIWLQRLEISGSVQGIYLEASNLATIQSFSINNCGMGVRFTASSNLFLSGMQVDSCDTGIWSSDSSLSVHDASIDAIAMGVDMSGSTSLTMDESTVTNATNYCIAAFGTSQLSLTNVTSSHGGIADLYTSNDADVVATSCDFDGAVICDILSTILWRYYADVYTINDRGGALAGSTVSVSDAGKTEVFNGTTGNDGHVRWVVLERGLQNAGGMTERTPHSFFAWNHPFYGTVNEEVRSDMLVTIVMGLLVTNYPVMTIEPPAIKSKLDAGTDETLILTVGNDAAASALLFYSLDTEYLTGDPRETVYSNNFTYRPLDWTDADIQGDGWIWSEYSMNLQTGYPNEGYLYTPVIDCGEHYDVELSYWCEWNASNAPFTVGQVMGSDDGGLSWPYFVDIILPGQNIVGERILSLPWADGKPEVMLVIHTYSEAGSSWRIDDFRMEGTWDVPGWIYIPSNGSMLLPGWTSPHDIVFDATKMHPGVYRAKIWVSSNDPYLPLVPVWANMTVNPGIASGVGIVKTVYNGSGWSDYVELPLMTTAANFRLTVENSGSAILDSVQVIDFLPQGMAYSGFASLDGSPHQPDFIDAIGNRLVWNITGPVAIGATHTIEFTCAISTAGLYENDAAAIGICAAFGDTPYEFGRAYVEYDAPVIDFEKFIRNGSWDKDGTYEIGLNATYLLKVWNNGTVGVPYVNVTDILPENLAYAGWSFVNGVPSSPSWIVYGATQTALFWNVTQGLGPHSHLEIIVFVNPLEVGTYVNTASASYLHPTLGILPPLVSQASIHVPWPQPSAFFSKTVYDMATGTWLDTTDALVRDRVRFNLTVRNTQRVQYDYVNLTDELDFYEAGVDETWMDYIGNVTLNGLPWGSPVVNGNTLWWNITAPLLPGETLWLEFDTVARGWSGWADNSARLSVFNSRYGIGMMDLTDWAGANCTLVNNAPEVNLGPDRVSLFGTEFVLDGVNATTEDHEVLTYHWHYVYDGTVYAVPDANESLFSYVFPWLGWYTLNLTVTDIYGLVGSDEIAIQVIDLTPPVADAGPDQSVPSGTTVTFDGRGSYDNVGIVSFLWKFTYDGMPTMLYSDMDSFLFAKPGSYLVNLTVRDAADLPGWDTMWVNVSDSAPVANAGPDQSVDWGELVVFNASASYDDVGIVAYYWSFTYNETTHVFYEAQFSFRFFMHGIKSVYLQVVDTTGKSGYDSMRVTVTDNIPPIAFAGPDQNVTWGAVNFDSAGSWDNCGIASYQWSFWDGGDFVTITGATASYIFTATGSYYVSLSVTDVAGLTDEDYLWVNVTVSQEPIAMAGGPYTFEAGAESAFDGTGSFDNIGVVNWTWTFIHLMEPVVLYGAQPTYSFHQVGFIVVTLTVRDADGNEDTDTVTVLVIDQVLPVADAGPDQTVGSNVAVQFNGSGSSDNIGIVDYCWYFLYDGWWRFLHGETQSFQFEILGDYEVFLNVTDVWNNRNTDSMWVHVFDGTPPVADAGADQAVYPDDVVAFDGSASSDNGGVVNWTWSFTEDSVPVFMWGVNPSHAFTSLSPAYVVTLRVYDAEGNWDEDTMTVTIMYPVSWETPHEFEATVITHHICIDNLTIGNAANATGNLSFSLSVDYLTAIPPSEIYANDFLSNPAEWTITNLQDLAWEHDSWDGRMENHWAYPSEGYLTSPVIDCTDYADVNLTYHSVWQTFIGGDQFGRVEGSNDGGMTWPHLLADLEQGVNDGGSTHTFDASWADGQSGVRFRFYVYNDDGGWWYVDDFGVTGARNQDWVQPEIMAGILVPGEEAKVTVTFNATLLEPGYYQAVIWKTMNDPFKPLMPVYVNLTVLPTPVPRVSLEKEVWSGTAWVNNTVIYDNTAPVLFRLTVTNTGDFPLDQVMVWDAVIDELVFTGNTWVDGVLSVPFDNGTFTGYLAWWLVFPFPIGDSVEIVVEMVVTMPGTYVNWASSIGVSAVGGNSADDAFDNATIEHIDGVAPVADAGPDQTVQVHSDVVFNGTQSHDNIGLVYCNWTFTYDGQLVLLAGNLADFVFDIPGVYLVTLEVKDAAGNAGVDTLTLTVVDANPPVANAGPDQTAPQNVAVAFDASSSTDDIGIASYDWTFTYLGAPIVRTTATFSFTFGIVGSYLVTLTVTDVEGLSDTDTMRVNITDSEKPVADAGTDVVMEWGNMATFNASASHDNVGIVQYTWTLFYDGFLDTVIGETVGYGFAIVGTYEVTLNVTDAMGNWDTDEVMITVIDSVAPTADAGPNQAVSSGTLVSFDGTGSTDDYGIAQYGWSFVYDGMGRNLNGPSPAFLFSINGTYVVTLTVVDVYGNADTATMTVKVGWTCTLPLSAGWNLISIPTLEEDWAVSVLFLEIMPHIVSMHAYDAESGTWLKYERGMPQWLNTLNELSPSMGVWVRMDQAVELHLSGAIRTLPAFVELEKGWNLVGYPTASTGATIGQSLVGLPWDLVQKCDTSRAYNLKTMPSTYTMRPGEGYWIHVTEDCVWTPAASGEDGVEPTDGDGPDNPCTQAGGESPSTTLLPDAEAGDKTPSITLLPDAVSLLAIAIGAVIMRRRR